MLVLSQKENETVLLGPHEDELVRVTVVGIGAIYVRLGIAAPRHMPVYRSANGEPPIRAIPCVEQKDRTEGRVRRCASHCDQDSLKTYQVGD